MVVTRDIEPWDELLQAGRDDDRLFCCCLCQSRVICGENHQGCAENRQYQRAPNTRKEEGFSHKARS